MNLAVPIPQRRTRRRPWRARRREAVATHARGFERRCFFDPNGNVVSVTDNLNRVTLTQYDELNRPVRIVGPQYSDAALGAIRPVTAFQYDNLGNRTLVKAGYTTDTTGVGTTLDVVNPQLTAAYDDFGRRIRETDALGKSATWQYDVNNNVTLAVDRKLQTTRFTWYYGHQLKTFQCPVRLSTAHF